MKAEYISLSLASWKDLEVARKWTHRAVQLIALIPRGMLSPDPGDGNANLGWDQDLRMLVSKPFGSSGHYAAMRISDLSLHLLHKRATIAELGLRGFEQDQILEWIKEQVALFGESTDRLTLELPYRIPEYPDIDDRSFRTDVPESFEALSNCFGNAHLVLEDFRSGHENSSEVRCWPHHFDMATLLSVDDNPDPESAKSIGVGFSPGDGNYSTPYYYVTPWPYPDVDISKLPAFTAGGEWNTNGWVGALLMVDRISEAGGAAAQLEIITGFINEAIAALREHE